ncbi:MAG: efflux RND transporter permease subunit, partial [Pseudomonadota bacterium]
MSAMVPKGVTGVLSYFTRHGTAANLILVVMVILGLAASTQIRSQFFPDVVIQNVTVSVNWDGAGPEDVDGAIVSVLEPAMLGIAGVQEVSSRSNEGSGRITLSFEPDWDMERAYDEVTAAVESVNTLPDGAEDVEVRRGEWRDRVTDVVISGPVEPEQLGQFADEFVTRLFAEGITRTTIRAHRSRFPALRRP